MKEDAQRIAIAEWMGWQWYRIPNSEKNSRGPLRCLFLPAIHDECQPPEWLVRADGTERICNPVYMWREGMVPDYTKDLNAIREAASKLPATRRGYFNAELFLLATERNLSSAIREPEFIFAALQATAAQRAEALLKALGLWKDE